jgi:hypothetical protein
MSPLIGRVLVIGGVLLLFAALGGFWGWRRSTNALYWRSSPYSERPDTMSVSEYERAIVTSRKRWRPFVAALYSLGGALVGCAMLMVVATRG